VVFCVLHDQLARLARYKCAADALFLCGS